MTKQLHSLQRVLRTVLLLPASRSGRNEIRRGLILTR